MTSSRVAPPPHFPLNTEQHALRPHRIKGRAGALALHVGVIGNARHVAYAQRAQGLLDVVAVGLRCAGGIGIHPGGQHALRQVIDALKVDAAAYHQVAAAVEVLKRALGRLPVPPGSPPRPFVVKVGGAQAALGRDAPAHQRDGGRGFVKRQPAAPAQAGPLTALLHARQAVAKVVQRDERRGLFPELEVASFAGTKEQRIQLCRVVAAEPAPQRQVVTARDHLQRVNLQAAQRQHGRMDGLRVRCCGGPRGQALGVQRQRAAGLQGNRTGGERGHGQVLACVDGQRRLA